MTAPARPILGLPVREIIQRLTPEQRRAFEHERRRRDTDIEALAYGIVLPEVAENLMLGPRHA